MGRLIDDVVPFDAMLAGITADVVQQQDPSGTSSYRLLDAVERHATAEAESLGHYRYLADQSEDPVVALIMRLILDDEDRHHSLLKRIATTLRDALNWTYSADALPDGGAAHTTDGSRQRELVALCRLLIEEERTGAQALRRLADHGHGLGGGLDELLLDMMAMDSEKHARLLHFVQKRLEARER
ncbi:MAG: hypothetical protein NVSMB2_06950 [Chloroflexota bacterium]